MAGIAIQLPPYTVTGAVTRRRHRYPARHQPVPTLGAAVADMPGLLAAGVQIPLAGRGSYTTAAGDTRPQSLGRRTSPPKAWPPTPRRSRGGPVAGVAIQLPPYTVTGPYFFAPRPLSTALWSSPGPIEHPWLHPRPNLRPAQRTSFAGVDLDGWAQPFLAQFDLVLSSDYAVAAYTLDPARYTALVQAKQTLAAAIADSVRPAPFQPGPGLTGPGPYLAGAQDTPYQRLLVTLSTAYQVDTIVQLPVTVSAPADWTGDTAPRLRGAAARRQLHRPRRRNPELDRDVLRCAAGVAGHRAGRLWPPARAGHFDHYPWRQPDHHVRGAPWPAWRATSR